MIKYRSAPLIRQGSLIGTEKKFFQMKYFYILSILRYIFWYRSKALVLWAGHYGILQDLIINGAQKTLFSITLDGGEYSY